MKARKIPTTFAFLVVTAIAISTGFSDLTSSGRRLESRFEKQLESLEEELKGSLPLPDKGRRSDFLDARKAESAAIAALEEAQKRHAKYGQAKGLVDHAKGKWIKDAEKGLAKAEAKLKDAEGADERQAAKEEIAKWEKNRDEGLKALEEREDLLKEAARDKPKAERALKDAKEELTRAKAQTIEELERLGLNKLLTSDAFDSRLARYVVMRDATPKGLALIAQEGADEEKMVEAILADDELLVQMLVADGAKDGNYGQALKIYHAIREASPKAAEGPLQRLALATALEHATPVKQRSAKAAKDAPAHVDPLARYLQYEKAFLDGKLDPAFANLSVWDMRMVVDGEEPPEISEWGREMLRSFRPDHVTMSDYRWRYVALVRSDIPYGSQNVKYDQDELQFFQNILMNGGICGRRAFIGRFILRAFGVPTTARPQKGHAALAHWTPEGWVICLGAGWGSGWTKTAYHGDKDFLASTQARSTGSHFLRVKRAQWIADLMGEKRIWGFDGRHEPEFWNAASLYTQRALIEAADAKTLEAVGEDIAEASDTNEKIEIADVEITDKDRKVRIEDGVVVIPAAATKEPTGNSGGILFMDSNLGGKQLHYSRGKNPEFEYSFQAPDDGKYALVARVATPSWQLAFSVTVNGDDQVEMPLPHTVGLWEMSEPVAVELKNDRNVLRFKRAAESNEKGISIHEFKLVPWDRRLSFLNKDEAPTAMETPKEPDPFRAVLNQTLLRELARLSSAGALQPLPMDLSITSSKVLLLEAQGSGILAFQSPEGGKIVPVALEDLALEDHALLARLVARISPADASANALAGAYMKLIGNPSLAEAYLRKAGPEAAGQFLVTQEGTSE